MLTDEERRRLEELSRKMNEPSLTPEESAELGNLMALDMGASRGPYQPPRSYGHEAEAVASTAN
jgi:hypothetical protein